jgi:hypothetical protein
MVLEYEWLNKEQSEYIAELVNMLEAVEKKHKKWIHKFIHYKVENFTILDQ